MEITINYLAVFVATIVNMGIGTLWYGPLFGKQWMRMMGYTPESVKAMKLSPGAAMGIMAVLALLMNFVLAHLVAMGTIVFGTGGVERGLTAAFWAWLGFCVPLTASAFLWENKGWKLWFFNAAYYLATLLTAGAILGGWA